MFLAYQTVLGVWMLGVHFTILPPACGSADSVCGLGRGLAGLAIVPSVMIGVAAYRVGMRRDPGGALAWMGASLLAALVLAAVVFGGA